MDWQVGGMQPGLAAEQSDRILVGDNILEVDGFAVFGGQRL